MKLPARDHRISLQEAAALTKRHRDARADAEKAGAFHKDQVIEMLSQPGCEGLRIYHGISGEGKPAFVLVGIDGDGKDLLGVILEIQMPCPPFCDGTSALGA